MWADLLILAQSTAPLAPTGIDIPFEVLLGPFALTAYLLYRDRQREQKIEKLETEIKELNKESKDMGKAALAALEKIGKAP